LFIVNLVRSVPQIIGLLLGYILLTLWLENDIIHTQLAQVMWMAIITGCICSLEVMDLISERITHFKKLDFFSAMLCVGISEWRIINVEILGKSSRTHLLHKAVSLFGVAILLQCSIDFIISVGLSNDVSLVNFPPTLGSVLAKLDSKQDILALGSIILTPSYIPELFLQHLQGVSVAFIIVFSLLCIYQITDGLVRRYDL
jgi:ABC-type dipeptide/oligopeptide/nickel transport system permease subunit